MNRDIAVTWPKTRSLESYLVELDRAVQHDLHINYRVARLPRWKDAVEDHGFTSWTYGIEHPRCFMVHDGRVRGWCGIIGTCHREEGEVEGWPAGLYIVRSPEWHPLPKEWREPGFRGWRWVTEPCADLWLNP